MISVTKNSNQNQLQQVEIMFTFIAPATPRGQLHMRVASFYELLKILLALLVKTLAYTIGTTSNHQRATWPELYPKSIVFLGIVVWHMRVFSHLPNVWGYSAGCCDVIKNTTKNAFLLQILKLPCTIMWQPRNPYVTCISCMLTWPDFRAYRDQSTTCCIRLFDPCINYAQCLCTGGLIRLTRKKCFFCLYFPECYPYNRNLWFLVKKGIN